MSFNLRLINVVDEVAIRRYSYTSTGPKKGEIVPFERTKKLPQMIEPILSQESKRQTIEFDLSNTLPDPELPSLNLSLTLHEHSRCGKVWFKGDLTHDNLRSLSIILEDMVFKLAAMESIP